MIRDEAFWTEEADAPLMNRNAGFIKKGMDFEKLISRIEMWADLVEADGPCPREVVLLKECPDEAARRIFKLDAERTFKTASRRQEMIEVLQTMWDEIKDYHQGLGYVVSFLLLFLSKEKVARICMNLHLKQKYMPGYWHAAPAAFVRDARIYQKLLDKFLPDAAKHIRAQAGLVPEAYAQKWFVGLCVHVLPFEALVEFYEHYFTKGHEFLFQFSMALVQNVQSDILSTKDVSKIMAMLRLDAATYPDTTPSKGDAETRTMFAKIVADAAAFELGQETDIEKMRTEEVRQLAEEAERRKQREKELGLDDDDEIKFSDEED